MKTEPALCEGIVLSDHAIIEQGTQKPSLIGCFAAFNCAQFPFRTPRFVVTPFLTNLSGADGAEQKLDLCIRVEHPRTGHVLTSVSVQLRYEGAAPPSPDEVITLPIPIPQVTVPEAGKYVVTVLLNNEKLGQRHILFNPVSAAAAPPKEG